MTAGRRRPLRVALTIGVQATGGVRRQALELAAWMLQRDEVELVPIGSEANLAALAELAGVAPGRSVVVPTTQGALEVLWTRYALDRRLAREQVDVLHCVKTMAPRRSRVPVVLTVNDFLVVDRPQDFTRAKAMFLPRLFLRSVRGADHWIAIADSVAADAQSRLGIPSQAITTIYPGASALTDTPPEVVEGVPPRYALAVGDLSPRKNVAFLARLWADVHEATGLHLIAAGPEGWRSEEAQRSLVGLERAGIGRWVGRVSDGELRWLYEHASVVCVPSIAEGYGIAVVEGVAFGRPVVASDVPSLQEAAAGSVVSVALTDPDRWVEAIAAAARTDPPPPVVTQSWADAAAQTLEVYERVVGRARGRTTTADRARHAPSA